VKSLAKQVLFNALTIGLIATSHAHEEEITIGRSGAGQLKAHVEFEEALPLPASIVPGIFGFATGEVGIHSALLEEPLEDFYPLAPEADVRLQLLAKTPGMEIWNDTGSEFMATNETFFVGHAAFDTHPVWNIVRAAPAGPYVLTFRLHDVTGTYADSEPFDVSFTPDTQPGPFEIQFSRASAAQIALGWSTNAVGWELQFSTNLVSINWTLLTNAAVVTGSNFLLNISAVSDQRFFRLRRPGF
jgi:hypothetical protein